MIGSRKSYIQRLTISANRFYDTYCFVLRSVDKTYHFRIRDIPSSGCYSAWMFFSFFSTKMILLDIFCNLFFSFILWDEIASVFFLTHICIYFFSYYDYCIKSIERGFCNREKHCWQLPQVFVSVFLYTLDITHIDVCFGKNLHMSNLYVYITERAVNIVKCTCSYSLVSGILVSEVTRRWAASWARWPEVLSATHSYVPLSSSFAEDITTFDLRLWIKESSLF